MHLPFLHMPVLPSANVDGVGTPKFPFSRLNTPPARTPVLASHIPSRAHVPDSGPSWLATPSMCYPLILYSMPVYPGAPTLRFIQITNMLFVI
jgi:hypothetical protein